MIKMSKEATTVVETSRNAAEKAKALQRRNENSSRREWEGRSERIRTGEEKLFKQLSGELPQKIS